MLVYANMEYQRFMAVYTDENPAEPWRKGSFSRFGFPNETSVWFTAWILMTLADATYPEWEEQALFIDPNLRSETIDFFLNTQQQGGSWAEFTTVEDRNKFGYRLTNIDGSYQLLNLSLTAQVIIALQFNINAYGISTKLLTNAIVRGRQWLENYYHYIYDAFDMAIVTYALHITNSAEKDEAFSMLTLFKRMSKLKIFESKSYIFLIGSDDNGVYYSNLNLPGMLRTWPNINPRYEPKPVSTDFEAHAVAATGFVVMTYIHRLQVTETEQAGMLLKSRENN